MKIHNKISLIFLLTLIITAAGGEPVSANENIGVTRLAGTGRIETSIAVSKEAYTGSDSVILAGCNGEVDALTGTLLAADKDAPLLLTLKDSLHPELKNEIKRLSPETIYILGGESVVSKAVETELAKTYRVKRVAGKSREETALAVVKEVKGQTKRIFLAKGYDVLADALAIGPISGIKDMPVLLTGANKLPQATIDAMKELGVTHITIVGGEGAVSKSVENQLKGYAVDRISGSNRDKTAIAIANKYFTAPKKTIVANGYVFADALVGGYLGALYNSPVLLTAANKISDDTIKYLETNTKIPYVLGGESAISSGVHNGIKNAIEGGASQPSRNPSPPASSNKSRMSWPVPSSSRISSPFGYRIHPIYKDYRLHTGIDIPASSGNSILAASSGKVTASKWMGGYGNAIMIDHGGGISTLYAHSSLRLVSVGQTVKEGDLIAKIGSTGNSTGPHLHFEVRKNGDYVNPEPWVRGH